ncbi:MAG: hypothetical protein RL538_697 [Candidatus Parcubacteria bacterium]|jgi:hypothetical protein
MKYKNKQDYKGIVVKGDCTTINLKVLVAQITLLATLIYKALLTYQCRKRYIVRHK